MLASLVFIKCGWFPLIIKRDEPQRRYIEALETADAGDLRPLIAIFVESQRTALIDASEVAYDVSPITSTRDAVVAVRDRLIQRGKLPTTEWARAKETALLLYQLTREQFEEVAKELRREIGNLEGLNFAVAHGAPPVDPVRDAATRAAGIIPDLSEYNQTVRLMLNTGRQETMAISFQGIGPRCRGLIGVVAYLAIHTTETLLVEHPAFQINYEEDLETAKARFSTWLDGVIVRGLNEWRRSL